MVQWLISMHKAGCHFSKAIHSKELENQVMSRSVEVVSYIDMHEKKMLVKRNKYLSG